MKPFPQLKHATFYLVGGCVRDQLRGKPNKDRDFVVLTSESFDDLVHRITVEGRVYQAKKEFLTIRCRLGDEDLDIAYPRTEQGYVDGRHPTQVDLTHSLLEDAARRDFTINAMYMREDSTIYDPYDGQADLASGLIRCVGDPHERFAEDSLRILRAIRFACQFDFGIATSTLVAARDRALNHGLKGVSPERIYEELNKSFAANPYRTFQRLENLGLFETILAKGITFQVSLKDLGGAS